MSDEVGRLKRALVACAHFGGLEQCRHIAVNTLGSQEYRRLRDELSEHMLTAMLETQRLQVDEAKPGAEVR